MKRLPAFASVTVVLGLFAALSPACTTHGEGGRCDPTNIVNGQFADCDNGLTCYPAQDIHLPEGGNSQAAICCPTDRTQATTQICMLSPTAPGSDAGFPDGGFQDTGTVDSTVDQSTNDAPSDVTEDTTTDATGE